MPGTIRKVRPLEAKEIEDNEFMAAIGVVLWKLMKEKHGWTDDALAKEVKARLAHPEMYFEDFPAALQLMC